MKEAPIVVKEKSLPPLSIPESYKARITDVCQHMDINRLREKGRVIQVNPPEIFIPLYTLPLTKKSRMIWKFLTQSGCLLIEGDAGSGKTTLMKHIAYMTLNEHL